LIRGAITQLAWDSSLGSGSEIPIVFTFFDNNGNLLKDVRYGYTILYEDGTELITNIGNDLSNPGIMVMEGINTQMITFPALDLYRVNIAIFGQGINYDQTFAGIAEGILEIGSGGTKLLQQPTSTPEISIPDWVRNNAGWWSTGQIGDDDFASGIEYMIKEGIIQVPVTSSGQASGAQIPDWVRNNADWWSQGLISDDDFANGLQYMIENGIITI